MIYDCFLFFKHLHWFSPSCFLMRTRNAIITIKITTRIPMISPVDTESSSSFLGDLSVSLWDPDVISPPSSTEFSSSFSSSASLASASACSFASCSSYSSLYLSASSSAAILSASSCSSLNLSASAASSARRYCSSSSSSLFYSAKISKYSSRQSGISFRRPIAESYSLSLTFVTVCDMKPKKGVSVDYGIARTLELVAVPISTLEPPYLKTLI